jgi:hypothetical protein
VTAKITIDTPKDDDQVKNTGVLTVSGTATSDKSDLAVVCVVYTNRGMLQGEEQATAVPNGWSFQFPNVPTEEPITVWAQAVDADTTLNNAANQHVRMNTASSSSKRAIHGVKKMK